jgi:hypothetical protein
MQLKQVVLPAPFGPINPVIWPSATSKDTSFSAVMPPNRIVRLRTVNSAGTRCYFPAIVIARVSTSTPVGDQSVPSHFAAIICVIGKRKFGDVRITTPG